MNTITTKTRTAVMLYRLLADRAAVLSIRAASHGLPKAALHSKNQAITYRRMATNLRRAYHFQRSAVA